MKSFVREYGMNTLMEEDSERGLEQCLGSVQLIHHTHDVVVTGSIITNQLRFLFEEVAKLRTHSLTIHLVAGRRLLRHNK